MPAALLLEHGFNRGALAAARSLRRAGWDVGVGASERPGLAAASRSVRRVHHVPAPGESTTAFVDAVRAAVGDGAYDVVLPVDDAQVLALSEARASIPAIVPYPPHEAMLRVTDRLEVARAARGAGIAVPETRPAGDGPITWLDGHRVVVKTRGYASSGSGAARARIETRVGSPAEAEAWVAEVRDCGGEPLLQEVVEGHLMSLSTLVDAGGRLVAQMQQVTDATWPATAGVSTRARTVTVDPDLGPRVHRLLTDLGYWGLAQTQFLVPADGVPRLIDLNPRFYGSLALAVGAGLDLPVLWASTAIGLPVRPAEPRIGVRYHWLEGDVRRALRQRRRGLLRDLGESVLWAPGAVHGVWSPTDPRPAARALRRTVAGRLPRLGA